MNFSRMALGAGLMTTVGALSALSMACGGASASGGSSSSSGDDGYTGSLTVQNGTGQAICTLEVLQSDGYAAHTDQVEAGGSVSIDVDSPANYVFATACDGSGFAYEGSVSSSDSTITLGSGSEQSFQARQDYLFQQIRMSTTMPSNSRDSSLISQFQSAIEAKARDSGWIDEPTILLVASEWGIVRNRLTSIPTGRRIAALVGHRFNDGHCSIQVHTFAQTHDGNDFSGRIGYEGSSGNIYAGCTMIDALEGGGGGSSASSGGSAGSSGGGCSNTCSSSGDGECDDGGPNSLYAVCALGTDCDDCGAR
ncbi:MAG: hypothetical protein AB8H86_06505 [Polyangiales bacterium]